ncbi:MAG: hypothetical protein ACFE8J_07285 [Candidatus Heimdallarchaeota archaeon]
MVKIILRLIQKIYPGKWNDLDEIDKKFDEIELNLGYPPKKRYRSLMGAYDNDTLIVEREWDSMAKMEKLMTKSFLDEDYQKLNKKLESIVKWQKVELYIPYPTFPE